MKVKLFINENGNYTADIEVDDIKLTVEANLKSPRYVEYEGTDTEEWFYLEENYYEESARIIDVLGDRTNSQPEWIKWL